MITFREFILTVILSVMLVNTRYPSCKWQLLAGLFHE